MLDFDRREAAALPSPAPDRIEFCTIELSPLADGQFAVAVKHTVFDDAVFELIDQDIVSTRAVTLDEVMVLISHSLRTAFWPRAVPHLS